SPRFRRNTQMIRFLASIFRGLSFIIGITAPPPEADQRSFVFMWLGITVFVLAFSTVLFYAQSRVRLPSRADVLDRPVTPPGSVLSCRPRFRWTAQWMSSGLSRVSSMHSFSPPA